MVELLDFHDLPVQQLHRITGGLITPTVCRSRHPRRQFGSVEKVIEAMMNDRTDISTLSQANLAHIATNSDLDNHLKTSLNKINILKARLETLKFRLAQGSTKKNF